MKYMNLANDSGPAFYYTEAWRQTVEDHIDLIRNSANNTTQELAKNDAYRYRGDLFGLLTFMGIPPQHHYIVARINEMRNGSELTEFTTELILPSNDVIERIRYLAQTAYGE